MARASAIEMKITFPPERGTYADGIKIIGNSPHERIIKNSATLRNKSLDCFADEVNVEFG